MTIVSSSVGPELNAAQPLSLGCMVSGGTGVYSYQWTSTCSGNCLLNGGNSRAPTLARDAARSSDSGTYTCTVTDNAGNNGSNSTDVQVTGMMDTFKEIYKLQQIIYKFND